MEIQWQRGTFHKFYAQMKIRIGGKDTIDIHKGDEFEYDGSVVKYAGSEFPQPGLRGAIREGWATLDPRSEAHIAAVRPERAIAKAQSATTDLSHRIQRETPVSVDADDQDEDIVLAVKDREDARDKDGRGGHVTKDHNRRGIIASEVDSQEGVTVASLRNQSPTHTSTDMTKPHTTSGQIMDRHRKTVEGISITTNVEDIDPSQVSVDSDEAQVVGTVRQSTPVSEGGIQVKDTSGPQGVKKDKEMAKKKKSNGSSELSPKLKAARDIDPEFPEDWNFFAKPEDKLAKIKELGAGSDFLKALFASEGKKMKKVLQKEYPDILA